MIGVRLRHRQQRQKRVQEQRSSNACQAGLTAEAMVLRVRFMMPPGWRVPDGSGPRAAFRP